MRNTILLLFLLSALQGRAQDGMPQRYAAYNTWANTDLAQWLAQAPDSVLERHIESSFSSLRATVLHIWSAEYLWLQVLRDEPYEDNPTRDFTGDGAELLRRWLEASEAFRVYVDGLDEAALAGTRGGGEGRAPLHVADIIQHCMNHGTYHRGQLITMGRQAGLKDPPQTDFLRYVRLP